MFAVIDSRGGKSPDGRLPVRPALILGIAVLASVAVAAAMGLDFAVATFFATALALHEMVGT